MIDYEKDIEVLELLIKDCTQRIIVDMKDSPVNETLNDYINAIRHCIASHKAIASAVSELPSVGKEHWEECERHPARLRIKQLEAELEAVKESDAHREMELFSAKNKIKELSADLKIWETEH